MFVFACVDWANPHTLRNGDKMSYYKLADFISLRKGKKQSECLNSDDNAVRYIQIDDLRNDDNLKFTNDEKKVLINEKDVLIAWDGANAGTIGFNLNGSIGSTITAIKINEDFSNKVSAIYLGLFLRSKEKYLRERATGATIPHIQKDSLLELLLPLPSLSTQTKIAKILDKSTALIAKRKAQIAELDVLVQSVFLEMFGDPITNPKGWEIGKIKDVILKSQYGTSNKASETEGEYPILRMNNITYQGEMDYSNLKYIDLDEKDKEKHLVHKGELLFNRTNSKELVGKTGLYNLDKPMAFAGYLIKIIPNKEKINSQFLLAYMNSKYIKAILFNMAKNIIGMANINAKEMENISLYIPELNLQTQFAQIVEKIQTQKSQLQQSLTELEIQHQALMQRAFRGELV